MEPTQKSLSPHGLSVFWRMARKSRILGETGEWHAMAVVLMMMVVVVDGSTVAVLGDCY